MIKVPFTQYIPSIGKDATFQIPSFEIIDKTNNRVTFYPPGFDYGITQTDLIEFKTLYPHLTIDQIEDDMISILKYVSRCVQVENNEKKINPLGFMYKVFPSHRFGLLLYTDPDNIISYDEQVFYANYKTIENVLLVPFKW